jgi:hypothetical protein
VRGCDGAPPLKARFMKSVHKEIRTYKSTVTTMFTVRDFPYSFFTERSAHLRVQFRKLKEASPCEALPGWKISLPGSA